MWPTVLLNINYWKRSLETCAVSAEAPSVHCRILQSLSPEKTGKQRDDCQ